MRWSRGAPPGAGPTDAGFKYGVLRWRFAPSHPIWGPALSRKGLSARRKLMNNSYAARRFAIGEESRPTFPRYARLHQDRTRRRLVILAPERVYEVDAIGAAVLKLCDGERRVADIVSELAAIYSAPAEVIAKDVVKLLQGLADKRLLRDGPDKFAPPPLSADRGVLRAFRGRTGGFAGRIDPSLPAAMPLLLQPAGTGARRVGIERRRMGRDVPSGRGRRRHAIASFRRRADRAARLRCDSGPRRGRRPLHQPRHGGRPA